MQPIHLVWAPPGQIPTAGAYRSAIAVTFADLPAALAAAQTPPPHEPLLPWIAVEHCVLDPEECRVLYKYVKG